MSNPPSYDIRQRINQPLDQKRRNSFLKWWYRIAAPPDPEPSASLAEREKVRRCRLASLVLLLTICSVLIPAVYVFFSGNPTWIISMLIALALLGFVVYLNSQKRIIIVAIVLLLAAELWPGLSAFTQVHGMNASNLTTLDLTIQADLLAVSLLPAWWVFPVAFGNIVYIWLIIHLAPHAPIMEEILRNSSLQLFVQPASLHIIVAVVAFLWVNSSDHALRRADRAEEIARLQQEAVVQERAVVLHKQQLENSIQQISDVHARVANGDFSARVPLSKENVLWQIAGQLNNLLSRLQRMSQSEELMQRYNHAIAQLLTALHQSRSERRANWKKTGTPVDNIAALVLQEPGSRNKDAGRSPL